MLKLALRVGFLLPQTHLSQLRLPGLAVGLSPMGCTPDFSPGSTRSTQPGSQGLGSKNLLPALKAFILQLLTSAGLGF